MAKILLVDDAAFMRMMVKDTLTKNGYTDLYEAADGVQAIAQYNEVKPGPMSILWTQKVDLPPPHLE